jgi:N-acyl-D-aspartate/D-glutamate deacylase
MDAFGRPSTIVGSDGMPWLFEYGRTGDWDTPFGTGKGHPRGAGAHAKILRIARDNDDVDLMTAISKMSYQPARFLGSTMPQLRTRGRLQAGMTADITVFDPQTVTDNASWEEGQNTLPSTGIPYVIVNGTIVAKESQVQRVTPGVAIRNARTE